MPFELYPSDISRHFMLHSYGNIISTKAVLDGETKKGRPNAFLLQLLAYGIRSIMEKV